MSAKVGLGHPTQIWSKIYIIYNLYIILNKKRQALELWYDIFYSNCISIFTGDSSHQVCILIYFLLS